MRRLARRNQAAVFVLFLAAIVFALNASSAFAATPPANTVAPSLSGTAQDGKVLTAAKGTWTGVGPITYAYQWQASADGGSSWADIAGATATTFTPPAGSAGTQVRVLVTATNGGGATQAASPASAVILPNPPLNTVAPTLSATAKDGVAITVNKGTWTGVATITYTYQWQASTDGGTTWTDIPGATGTSYTPPAGSAGKQLHALVTASNGDGSSQATSAASAVIVSNPPVNTVAPSLTGTAKDGVALTAAKGTWTGMATITYTYQWQLTTDGGTTWTDIPGATGTTYTPPAGNNGNQARVLVTATNPDGTNQAPSPASALILPNPPLNTVAPSLPATAKDGVAITVNKGTWTGVATITYTYQWQASTDGGTTWTDIPGATGTSYTPPAGSAGKQLHALVTASNGDGSSQATSAASAVIVSNPPVNTVAPSLTGTAKDGVALTAAKGTWTGMATITYTYQWQLTTDGGTTWTDIPGATGTTYTPPAGNNGNQARVLVTATNPDGTNQAPSPASALILPNPPLNTVAPSLSATAKDGVAITVNKGTWTGVATITYTYQWQASTDGGTTWTDIPGATGNQLHTTRRLRRQTSTCARHRQQRRRQQPSHLSRKRRHRQQPTRQHRRTQPHRHRQRRRRPHRRKRHLDRHGHDHLHLPMAAHNRRRHHLDRHPRRNRHHLHPTRRQQRQPSTRPRHRHQPRRHQPSTLTRKRRHPPQPATQHRRANVDGHGEGRPTARSHGRYLERTRAHCLQLPVADLFGRRRHLDRHRRRNRDDLHTAGRFHRQTAARARDGHQC